MQDAKEEIRSRLNIEDVIGEYVSLRRAGRNFKGISPFTDEKTPSFIVSPDKSIWHDFSSNKGGDVFSFVMEVEGVEFREALEMLARKAGVELAAYDASGSQQRAKEKQRLLEMHDLATRYYQQSLMKNERAVEYVFRQRKLSKEVVQLFRLGFAPDTNDALVQFLTKKGFSAQELSSAGLVNRRGGDLFRGRMMVPLMDTSGQVIGFTGRIIGDVPNAPKYLNTPQTMLYDKGRHVFGLSQAKEAIRKSDYAVIVEGNLDVVSSHQVAVSPVVATAGTAITESHLKTLSRLTPNVRLSFDGDAAGVAATERAIPIAQRVGVELTIVTLPGDVKDPDELIQRSSDEWVQAIEKATPIVDWLFAQYSQREDMESAQGKRRFTTAALDVVRKLDDAVEAEHYLQRIAEDTGTSLEAVKAKLDFTPSEQKPLLRKKVAHSSSVTPDSQAYQDSLLALALIDPKTREGLGSLQSTMFSTPERQTIFSWVQSSDETVTDTPKDLHDLDTYVKILVLKADTRYGQWSDDDRLLEMTRLVRLTVKEHTQTQKETLTAELRAAEDAGDDVSAMRLKKKLNDLIKEMPRAKK
ncbi:DNA primase [Candidatus Saccharibacteria bacterium]|nr:DNA primase [Candidatus Saccharibacteria bacterium]NCS82865.1 DNA primase [Candidatus Saccharibacteria bacterium]